MRGLTLTLDINTVIIIYKYIIKISKIVEMRLVTGFQIK